VAIGYLRNDRAAEAAAEELRGVGAEPVLVRGNVSSERVAREVAGLGPLTALIHNAATGVIRPALEVEKKHWDWTLDANSYALLALAKAAAPQMQPGSSIVGLSSLGSTRVLENYVAVGTSKAALESLVRYLAVELAPRGIRVNAVSAGVVETEALEHFPNKDEMLPDVKGKHVLHLQCATGESTAELADLGALVTGVDISVEATAVARERVPNALFLEADVHHLPLQLERGRFDFVYTGGGIFHWLHDLDVWAHGIASALKRGGMLLAYDDHPVSACVDQASHWREDYFDESPIVDVGWRPL